MSSKIIALITDFGIADPFVGVMKGVILGINPKAQVVDVTHQVPPQDIRSAAFLLKYSYRYFPKGTIHLVVVDPGVGSWRRGLAVETEDYFFVAPDNGVISQALEVENVRRVVELKNRSYFLSNISRTFHGRDIFAPVSAYISLGTPLEKFGLEVRRIKKLSQTPPRVFRNEGKVAGQIAYIDRFGNLITDISQDLFEKMVSKRGFVIKLKGHEVRVKALSRSYSEAESGEVLVVFDSFGLLEISVSNGSAEKEFQAKVGEKVELSYPL